LKTNEHGQNLLLQIISLSAVDFLVAISTQRMGRLKGTESDFIGMPFLNMSGNGLSFICGVGEQPARSI
jgi:hypothetical protein